MEQVEPRGRMGPRPEEAVRAYTTLQMHFLLRLERLVALRDRLSSQRGEPSWLERALNKAIYSTFMDCVAQGVGEEAKAVLQGRRVTFP